MRCGFFFLQSSQERKHCGLMLFGNGQSHFLMFGLRSFQLPVEINYNGIKVRNLTDWLLEAEK